MGVLFHATTKFQSTPPCGGDINHKRAKIKTLYFNPRPLAGATGGDFCGDDCEDISIHAPLRGRRQHDDHLSKRPDFNPRPLAGATIILRRHNGLEDISIHAPLRGRRRGLQRPRSSVVISIHAPLRGRRCGIQRP